jgi:hypothetical protein
MDPGPSLALHAQAAAWSGDSLVFFVFTGIFVHSEKNTSEYKIFAFSFY